MHSVQLADDDWRLIVRRILNERCVPFLGAGASLGRGDAPCMPTASQLAEELAKECDYPGIDKSDLFRIAQYYRMVEDAYELRNSICKKLRVRNVRPALVHQMLAGLPFRYVLTTNFDNLMERAFEEAGKNPHTAAYELHGDKQDLHAATLNEPLVYKLHGFLDKPETMVVTEDDVIEFLCCLMLEDPPLPPLIKGLFQDQSMLFIGYGLKDWDVRVMLRAIRGKKLSAPPEMASFAIQRRPEDLGLGKEWDTSVIYWERKASIKCFDIDAIKFVTELKNRYDSGK